MNTEVELAYKALDIIRLNTGLIGHWLTSVRQVQAIDDIDGQIAFKDGQGKTFFFAIVKTEVKNYQLEQILRHARQNTPLIVFAKRIYPKMKEALRQNGIAYAEENGNFFLKNGTTHILIDGKKNLVVDKEKTNRAFTKTGLKVIFEFLLDETLINTPYRQIARRTKTGLGNINYIVNGLKKDGFLLPGDKETYKLIHKKELLEKWISLYAQKLKPALRIGQFRLLKAEDLRDWKRLPLQPMKTWWGGEPAGDLLTDYLKPAILTIYTFEATDELIRHYRLIPDEKGPIEIYRRFWEWNDVNDNIVPPCWYTLT